MFKHATNVYPAGTAIMFTSGKYSDFQNEGAVVTLKECDIAALIEEYKEGFKPDPNHKEPDQSGFIAWLIGNGYVFPANIYDVYLGYYDLELG